MKKPKKVFVIVNSPIFIYQHLLPIINLLKKNSELYIITPKDKRFKLDFKEIKFIYLPIKRDPSLNDLNILIQLIFIKIKYKPNISISFTPKGALINSLSSFIGQKTIHYFTGQRWASFKGIKRLFFKTIDKIMIAFFSEVYCDSPSQAQFIARELKVNTPKVIGNGSLSGVDIKKFSYKKGESLDILKETSNFTKRNLFEILEDSYRGKKKIFCFIGRLNRDKGIRELLQGFNCHNKLFPESYLLIIGSNELSKSDYKKLRRTNNCFHLDFTDKIHLILPFAYALILPSYREGFGSVILEAAASHVPVIATDIPGPRDFIKHKVNGYLIKPKDPLQVQEALTYYQVNEEIIKDYARISFAKCKENFSQEYVCNMFIRRIIE